jgi:hypothetical protein
MVPLWKHRMMDLRSVFYLGGIPGGILPLANLFLILVGVTEGWVVQSLLVIGSIPG